MARRRRAVEVPMWPSCFAVPDLEPALLFEMELLDDNSKAGARAVAGAALVVEVAEGTLKVQDMPWVRDAIWSQTGFD